MTRPFASLLIANRGEIAVRVVRTAKRLGIRTIAVYSDADASAAHVAAADEAVPIGPPPARESYLNIDAIIEAAGKSAAEAVHPGYGFLSENARFAEACAAAGIVFVGPPASAIRAMGLKDRAKEIMAKAGVAVVPGYLGEDQSAEKLAKEAARIGYPVMLKAAAGGGGKGMRLVHAPGELRSALESARSEAERSFGDSEVYIEKAILNPRHIEMQILADEHGNTVYLGERECSLQRRHQKVVEEAPSPIVDAEMRRQMGEIAVRVAQAAGYTNAGTVEFLVDQQKNFYFLEMNTRLQVEHPVTELVTGLDLVHLQIRIANGERLPFTQDDIKIRGHAIECRIYAEDPDNNYFPSPGKITLLLLPSGPGIRRDSGMYEGWTVPMDYDPLLAKLIGYGTDRDQAIGRLTRALNEYFVGGIKTNISLFRRILSNPEFRAAKMDTGFLDRLLKHHDAQPAADPRAMEVAVIAAGMYAVLGAAAAGAGERPVANVDAASKPSVVSNWKSAAHKESIR